MSHLHQRRVLRSAFVVTVGAALAAAGCETTVTNTSNANCPATVPSGACSDEGLSCQYTDECALPLTASCIDGDWQVKLEGTCNPPPPGECPETAPFFGASCDAQGLVCSYMDECDQAYSATCDSGAWNVGSPDWSCNPPTPCPPEVPEVGTTCTVTGFTPPANCMYTIDACGPQPVTMSCVYDETDTPTWRYDVPPICDGLPQDCQLFGDAFACDDTPECAWHTPGCNDDGTLPDVVEGCYPAGDCTVTGCGDWGTCTAVVSDPCWNANCGACAAETNVCVADEG